MARALRWIALAAVLSGLPLASARADDGVDHAFDMSRPRASLGVGYTLGAGGSLAAPPFTSFDPTDPRIGAILLAAYGPSPLLLIDMFAAQSENRSFTIAELLAASVGLVIAFDGFVDSFGHEDGTGLSIASLATAQAMALNAQMITNGLERLVFGDITGTPREASVPEFLPVPFEAGAGVVMRWEN